MLSQSPQAKVQAPEGEGFCYRKIFAQSLDDGFCGGSHTVPFTREPPHQARESFGDSSVICLSEVECSVQQKTCHQIRGLICTGSAESLRYVNQLTTKIANLFSIRKVPRLNACCMNGHVPQVWIALNDVSKTSCAYKLVNLFAQRVRRWKPAQNGMQQTPSGWTVGLLANCGHHRFQHLIQHGRERLGNLAW